MWKNDVCERTAVASLQPQIQRIVWLYKRWQPLYAIIKSTVTPKVEFIQGIPQELDDDDYFNPRQNNLLKLDDMMSTTGKDKCITDLSTEGSHHRSLSIISVNQNLYATKDPTQRRNCHYLILYDNPVNRPMTFALARQMFPKIQTNSLDYLKRQQNARMGFAFGFETFHTSQSAYQIQHKVEGQIHRAYKRRKSLFK